MERRLPAELERVRGVPLPPPRSPLEAVVMSIRLQRASGLLPADVAEELMLSEFLSVLEQLELVNKEYRRVFVDTVNKCLRMLFSEDVPPFEPRTTDYLGELLEYMREVPSVAERIRRVLGGKPVTVNQSEGVRRRLAVKVLVTAGEAFFKEVGLLTNTVE